MPGAEMVHTWRLANARGGGGWQALAVHQEPDCENHHNKQQVYNVLVAHDRRSRLHPCAMKGRLDDRPDDADGAGAEAHH